ncbi:hypothetical protein NBO_20g0007 [Nosema bombycis CQ1]|uniref:Uncharacterized protein n=1 Tax=Nosema bombycis (strain CQ1 / CVCC 102059) TaxID=578461 RepID=R0M9F9_NOSB1|nr:hypothetical protein NBO_20g0007 [Nosema bombycis CQ1]|eukprot:EOB14619.1 hypothetical protein NBO_20g0007 [Nosema bombycis CQ1]
MKNNVFYSEFLSKLASFNFTNIIFGLRIFKNFLKISNSKYENLDFLYSVCCVIASKYLDDIHVYNNNISECSYIVNKLEMKILSTLNYSIEFDLINYYSTINEIFK